MMRYGWLHIIAIFFVVTSCSTTSKLSRKGDENKLSSAQSRKFDYFFQESLRQKSLSSFDASFDLMKKALTIDPESAPAHYELANYYIQLNRPLIALEYIQDAYKKEPNNYWYGMMAAQLMQNLNMGDEAIAVYKSLAEIYPEKPEINYSLADVYTQKGEVRNAIESLNRLEDNIGVNEAVIMEKHRLYMSLQKTDSAFMEIKNLIAAYPSNIQYQILLGDLYLGQGMLQQADSAYNEASKTDPEDAYLLVARANYFNQIGNIQASNKLVKSALVNDRLDVDTKIKILTGYLSTLLQKKEPLQETDSLFTIVLDQHPQESELHALYADLLITTNRLQDAREQLGYAVDFNPNDQKLWMQLVGVNMNLKDYQEVVKTTTRAMNYLPSLPDLYLYQGVAYSLLDKPDQALQTYQLGLTKLDSDNVQMKSDIWGQIGDVYHKQGKREEAYQAYDEALRLNDKNIGVLNNYSYFLSLEKSDLNKAERMAGQVVKLEPNNPTYLDTYAWIYFQQGNYMLAKFYIQSAINKDKAPNSEVLEHYGDILFKNGEVDAAVEQWQKALEEAQKNDPQKDVRVLKKKIETKNYLPK